MNTQSEEQYYLKKVSSLQKINEYIVHRLNSGIIFVDDDWNIKLINDAAKKLFNQTNNVNEQHVSHVSQQLADKLTQWQNDPLTRTQAKHTVLANPELIAHFLPADPASEMLILIVLDDMRRLTQHAQQLKLASLGRFTASIAHELRNPLGAIGHAVQLLSESTDLTAEDRRLTEIIHNNCERMNTVIKNILQLSRRTKSSAESIGLKDFLENFTKEFLHFNKNPVNFTLKMQDENLNIFADKSQLTQILVNLCENAINYGKENNGKVNIDLIAERDPNNEISLRVKDYGDGIPGQAKEHLFEPFYTTSRSGMGMGLFITKELCQANQAQLTLDECEQGACFKINFNNNEELTL